MVTPGTWEVETIPTEHDDIFTYNILAPNTEPDAVYSGAKFMVAAGLDSPEDARLIAAAPELLRALQDLFQHCTMIHKQWGEGCNSKEAQAAQDAGRAAIAKATGK